MDFKYVEMEKKGTTRIFYFNSPPANGLNLEIVNELAQRISLLKAEESAIRCLIITGKLKGFFAAGADLKMIKKYMAGPSLMNDMLHFNTLLQGTINRLESLPYPVIAAINGHAMGAGLEVALACDFRFMSNDNAKVGLPEVRLGLLPGAGGLTRLPRLIGKSKAKDIIYNCKFIDAKTALAIGLVDQLYDPESLLDNTLQYAEELKELPRHSLAVVKKCINEGLEMQLENSLALEMKSFEILLNTEDMKEGVSAFLEKRKPVFKD